MQNVSTEADNTGAALSRAADNIYKLQLIRAFINTIYLNLINTVIYCTEIFIIRCRTYTVHMRAEISFRYTSKACMEYSVHNTAKTSVFMCVYNGHLTIMIACHIKIFAIYICCQKTSTHTVNINTVDT